MVKSRTVYCKVCGKKIAFWDMFHNLQYEDEYECFGEFRRKTRGNLWKSKDGKITLHSNRRDAENKKKYPIEVKYETLPCAIYYNTKYCKSCVRKIKYKCVRPRCKGPIRIVRRKDGKPTKYGHGGY